LQISCEYCGEIFEHTVSNTWWDYSGTDYDTKLSKCPRCGQLIILGYQEHPNREAWFYEYRREGK